MEIRILTLLLILFFNTNLDSQVERRIVQKRFVTVDRLNFRPKARKNCPRIKLLNKFDAVEILNIPSNDSDISYSDQLNGFWAHVIHDKDTGYVFDQYLSLMSLAELKNPSEDDIFWIYPMEYSSLPFSEQMQWYVLNEEKGYLKFKKIQKPPFKFNETREVFKYYYEKDTSAFLVATLKKVCEDPVGISKDSIDNFWIKPEEYFLKFPKNKNRKYKISYIQHINKLMLETFGEKDSLEEMVDLFIYSIYDKNRTWFSGVTWYGDLNCDNRPDFMLSFCGEESCINELLLSHGKNKYRSYNVFSGTPYYEDY